MPNIQGNIQQDPNGNVGINRGGVEDTIQEQLHIDGVLQIGSDFNSGNAIKIRRSPSTGKLEKDEGGGYVEFSSGGGGFGLYPPVEQVADYTPYMHMAEAENANQVASNGPINPIGNAVGTGEPLLPTPTPETVQSAALSGVIAEA